VEADPFVGQRMNCCHHESCGSQRLELFRMEPWQLDVVHGVAVRPLLSHARLPHGRERGKSPEVAVTHQLRVCNASAEGLLRPVSRTCTT
jgi:hypothetical protein